MPELLNMIIINKNEFPKKEEKKSSSIPSWIRKVPIIESKERREFGTLAVITIKKCSDLVTSLANKLGDYMQPPIIVYWRFSPRFSKRVSPAPNFNKRN